MFEISEEQKESILDELKGSGYASFENPLKHVSFTDDSCDQLNIELAENVYLFSQATFLLEGKKYNYYSEILDFDDFQDTKEQQKAIDGFYDSIEEVKEIYGDDWKFIVMECAFEQTCMTI